ncbi:MAG TPA: cupin domain-containing protein [Thermoplasmata archaeon]|nr:cupin domain-containing protein [Thermoplasmata archaeon]
MALWEDRPDAWHEVAPGVRRRILTHDPTVMMVLYEIAPGTTFPMHAHPHLQTGVVLEGGGSFSIGGDARPVRKGSSYLVPGGVPHELRTAADATTIVLDVFVPPREDFLGEALPPDRP